MIVGINLGRKYFMPKGTIIKIVSDRGFGFIQTAEGTDVFFHRSKVQGVEFTSLKKGQEVEFDIGHMPDKRQRAERVRLTQIKNEEHPHLMII
jgi:CspA family cold shock protein